jgi:hypothetical protein
MATFTKKILSGSTDGRGILVVATATPGTTIHTASSTPATIQEIWLYASNADSAAYTLNVEWGGVTALADNIKVNLAASSGLILIAPGIILKGNATPLIVKAYAGTTNKVSIFGYVNEIA